MKKLALAFLIVATPVAARDVTVSYEVRFRDATFTCGETTESMKTRHFMSASPSAWRLPVEEPLPDDPKARSWNIVYRIICENAYAKQVADREKLASPVQSASRKLRDRKEALAGH